MKVVEDQALRYLPTGRRRATTVQSDASIVVSKYIAWCMGEGGRYDLKRQKIQAALGDHDGRD